MMHLRTAVLTLALVAPTTVHAQDELVVTSDLLKIRRVTQIDVARDASRAVFSVQSIAEDHAARDGDVPKYEYRSHLYALDLFDPDASPRQLTFGDRRDGGAQISPDAKHVVFVRAGDEVDADGHGTGGQLWIMSLDGGEARQLTTMEHGASSPQWSADGTRVLFTSSLPVDELDGAPPWPSGRPARERGDVAEGVEPNVDGSMDEVRAWLAQNAERFDPYVIDRLNFQGERTLRRGMRFAQLFELEPSTAGEPPLQLTDAHRDHGSATYMPGGGIVYSARQNGLHPDDVARSQLRILEPDGDDRVLLDMPGWTISRPLPNHDGSMIAFSGSMMDHPTDRQTQLGIVPIEGGAAGEPVWMTDEATFDHDVNSFRWMASRSTLLFSAPLRGGTALMSIAPGLLKPAAVVDMRDGFPVGVGAFDVSGRTVVYAENSMTNPGVLRVRDGQGERLAWDLNAWVANKQLSMPSEFWIDRPDGTRVHAWIMEPIAREDDRTYPLVLEMHGGPSAMWGPGERSMWHEFQVLCARGYGVVYANPRGSGGYGYTFQRGNHQDWGDGPAGDVLAAVDDAILAHEWIDRERLVVTGGSYAGYLTAWIVSHDNRFKAAVAQRGVYDLGVFFGEGNAWRLVEWEMGGWPWEPSSRDTIRRNSPWTSVAHIRTPLLIMHASQDLRTGVSQSEMLYRALKVMGREVEYIRYPDAGHDLSRTGEPWQRMDRISRIVEFFDRYVGEERGAGSGIGRGSGRRSSGP